VVGCGACLPTLSRLSRLGKLRAQHSTKGGSPSAPCFLKHRSTLAQFKPKQVHLLRFLRVNRPRLISLLAFALLALAFAVGIRRIRVDMSIAHFLPRGSDPVLSDVLAALSDTPQARTLVVEVRSEKGASVVDATLRGMDALRQTLPSVEIRSGATSTEQEAIFSFLSSFPPSAFLGPNDYEAPALAFAGSALKEELGGPMGAFVAPMATEDPLMARLRLLRSFGEFSTQNLVSNNGVLASSDQTRAYVFVVPKASSLDGEEQARMLREVDNAFGRLGSPDFIVRKSGVARYAVATERAIRSDTERIGSLSTVGIVVFFVLLFRSPRMLLLGFVPLVCGSMAATLGTALIFGRVHGVTLAFGSSLLGVGIDYAEHYYTHFALSAEGASEQAKAGASGAKDLAAHPARVMDHVWPGLFLGALTTAVGLCGLAFADFPGALQMGVFSIISVFAAVLATRYLLPPWMPMPYRQPRLPSLLEGVALRLLAWIKETAWVRPALIVLLPLLLIFAARVRFDNDPRALIPAHPDLAADDAAIAEQVSVGDPGRFAIVLGEASRDAAGDDLSSATAKLAAVDGELRAARAAGLVRKFPPVAQLLRTREGQVASAKAAQTSAPALLDQFARNGFVREKFVGYQDRLQRSVSSGENAKLGPSPREVLASPAGVLVAPFVTKIGARSAYVLPLGGVDDIVALRRAVPSAIILDQGLLLREALTHARTSVTILLGVGLVLVILILFVRYRALQKTLIAILPALVSVCGTLACFALFGVKLTVFHTMGFSLVLSMGADYGIFVVESKDDVREVARAWVSIVVATLTTLLSFGLLALSGNPALSGLGLSITVGMLLCVVFCPAVWAVLQQKRRSGLS
jgi:predicted exporter